MSGPITSTIPTVAIMRAILYLESEGPILFQEIETSSKMAPATLAKGASMVFGEGMWLERDGGYRALSDDKWYRHTQIGTVGGRLAGGTNGKAPT